MALIMFVIRNEANHPIFFEFINVSKVVFGGNRSISADHKEGFRVRVVVACPYIETHEGGGFPSRTLYESIFEPLALFHGNYMCPRYRFIKALILTAEGASLPSSLGLPYADKNYFDTRRLWVIGWFLVFHHQPLMRFLLSWSDFLIGDVLDYVLASSHTFRQALTCSTYKPRFRQYPANSASLKEEVSRTPVNLSCELHPFWPLPRSGRRRAFARASLRRLYNVGGEMPSSRATSGTVRLLGGNNFFRTGSFRFTKCLMQDLTSALNRTINNLVNQRDFYPNMRGLRTKSRLFLWGLFDHSSHLVDEIYFFSAVLATTPVLEEEKQLQLYSFLIFIQIHAHKTVLAITILFLIGKQATIVSNQM